MITPRDYAQAFMEVGSKEDAIANLLRVMRKNGDWSRRAKIVAAIEAGARARAGKALMGVLSARPLTAKQRAMIEEKFPENKFDTEYRVSREVIAGVRIEIDGESQIDATLASALRKMFTKQ